MPSSTNRAPASRIFFHHGKLCVPVSTTGVAVCSLTSAWDSQNSSHFSNRRRELYPGPGLGTKSLNPTGVNNCAVSIP